MNNTLNARVTIHRCDPLDGMRSSCLVLFAVVCCVVVVVVVVVVGVMQW